MSAKQRAIELYNQHIGLAATDGRLFRKTVMETLQQELGITESAAATHYNNAKKSAPPVDGLGRAPVPKGVVKPGSKSKKTIQLQDDNDCFTVIELVKSEGNTVVVGRCQSFLIQGDASECFDVKTEAWPGSVWVLIQGLGPNSGETYRLGHGEKEIKRFSKEQETV